MLCGAISVLQEIWPICIQWLMLLMPETVGPKGCANYRRFLNFLWMLVRETRRMLCWGSPDTISGYPSCLLGHIWASLIGNWFALLDILSGIVWMLTPTYQSISVGVIFSVCLLYRLKKYQPFSRWNILEYKMKWKLVFRVTILAYSNLILLPL